MVAFFLTFSKQSKKIIKAILCNFSMRLLECFLNILKKNFALKKLKKTPSKVAQKNSNPLFFLLTASTAQMAQTEEFMFENVAYRPTVYRTGP